MPEASNTRKSLFIIDGHAQIFRAYHAIRGGMTSPVTQEPTNATFGFVGMLIKLLREYNPDYLVVTFDVSGDRKTFRSDLYPEYKANRKPAPEDLHPQVLRVRSLCETWGIPVIGVVGVEADDVIATLVERHAEADDLEIKIVSKDKDLQQLITPHVAMIDVHKDEIIDLAGLKETKGITPEQVIDMLALMGDNVDNVPGVPGVGPKTAAKLINQYGSLDELLAHTDDLRGKLKENLVAHADKIPLSKELVTLKRDVEFDFNLEDAKVAPPPVAALHPIMIELGFNRHERDLAKLAPAPAPGGEDAPKPEAEEPARPKKPAPRVDHSDGLFASHAAADDLELPPRPADIADYTCIKSKKDLKALVAELKKLKGPLSVDTETDRLDPMQAQLVGICLAWKPDHAVYVPVRSSQPEDHLDPDTVIDALRPILEDESIPKVAQNLKYDLLILRNAGINLAIGSTSFDTMVASYLIDATRSSHKLDHLALAFLDREMIPITDLIGPRGKNQKSMIDHTADAVTKYSAEDADVTLQLRNHFAPQLESNELTELFETLEMPLVEVLAELEYNGVLVDPDELDRQNKAIDARINELADAIIDKAGADFNPDSPKQLADILFNQLGCKVVKKLKTGPSTDSEVLTKIAEEQDGPGAEVASLILEYRQLTKLRGTYLESLKTAINPETKRIHASFNQTVTVTGRLSSSDPNLQNIPIRTELGRQIRKAFVAPPGSVLLGADYSQIELRLLAHLSQDAGLIEAFNSDADIHRIVAAQVFEIDPEDVTSEQRGVAKMVNFGIVYGITPFGLARRLPPGTYGSDNKEAAAIIDDYKQRYPGITQFLDACVEKATTDGYVETIAGRRRSIPNIESRNPNLRGFAERTAINTVVQGSAADLIKIAMVDLHQRIRDEKLPMKMLLQIHDELVFEVPEDQAEPQSVFIRDRMQAAMELAVPLKVEVSWGTSWFETK